MTLTVQGEVERITFENEQTGFRVVRLREVSGAAGVSQLTIVGTMPAVGLGLRVRVAGRLEENKKHGTRLLVQSLVVVAPDTLLGVEKYLASGILPGVGETLAQRVVKCFGMDTLRVLDTQSHRLSEVPGFGKKKVDAARQAWSEHQVLSNTLLVLQEYGVTPALAKKIIDQFGERSAETVEHYPYRLALQVVGVGFRTADQIARARGLPHNHPERAQAGLFHQLIAARDQGHCFCDKELLLERTADMLNLPTEQLGPALDQLWLNQHVVIEDQRVFLRPLFEAEQRIATRVKKLTQASQQSASDFQVRLERFETEAGFTLAPSQRRAVALASEHKFVIITGGPGVGKTTLVKALLAVFGAKNLRIALAAPTGRAAQRLSESTGQRAVTLHRLLEVGGLGQKFGRNAEHPLECDVLVIDESSMIDVQLGASLLEAVPDAARVILVGDADQLPSVGPGAVLLDLIASQVVPVVRLSEIFRQGENSGIIENSHRILQGEMPQGASTKDGDFFVIRVPSPERSLLTLKELLLERIPQRFAVDPRRDVQVLCPMHRGTAGTLNINQVLQTALNPRATGVAVGEVEFRSGDKVIQLKNDYFREVFNGDVGEVVEVDVAQGTVQVRYEGEDGPRLVPYERGELGQLGLAYCISVHKSQGSEYPVVVLLLLSAHYMMLSRNLLYTAVTRAKRVCVVLTDERALSLSLAETRKESRATGLSARLNALLGSTERSAG